MILILLFMWLCNLCTPYSTPIQDVYLDVLNPLSVFHTKCVPFGTQPHFGVNEFVNKNKNSSTKMTSKTQKETIKTSPKFCVPHLFRAHGITIPDVVYTRTLFSQLCADRSIAIMLKCPETSTYINFGDFCDFVFVIYCDSDYKHAFYMYHCPYVDKEYKHIDCEKWSIYKGEIAVASENKKKPQKIRNGNRSKIVITEKNSEKAYFPKKAKKKIAQATTQVLVKPLTYLNHVNRFKIIVAN